MRKTSKIILVTIIETSILLGLGYAAIQNITLNITGTATGITSQDNFKVRFTRVTDISDAVNVTASVNTDTTASINVTGLTEKGQSVTATYEIENQSNDLSSDLNVNTTNSNTEYFVITSRLNKTSLMAGEKTTVTVTVEMIKTPIDGSVTSNVGVNLTAIPVEPGKEGTSADINDFSQTPELVNEYGFYFNESYVFYNESMEEYNNIIFYEDGSCEFYMDGVIAFLGEKDSVKYSDFSIDVSESYGEDGAIVTVLLDGKTMEFMGAEGKLDETFMRKINVLKNKQNSYGFYYDVPYTMISGSELNTMILHEDGSCEFYIDRALVKIFPAGTIIYDEYSIDLTSCLGDGYIATVSSDGRFVQVDEMLGSVDMTFMDNINSLDYSKNEYGFYFNAPYSTYISDGVLTIMFYEDGSADVFLDGVYQSSENAGVFTYTDERIISMDLLVYINQDGKILYYNQNGFCLDVNFYDRYSQEER